MMSIFAGCHERAAQASAASSTAVYTRDEVEMLISDERITTDRRVLYALEGLAALRHGEAAGLRWRHYDPTATPVGG